MPVVSLLFGLACGLVVWVVLDPVQSRALEEIFRSDLEARLDREAQDGFHRFEHYTEGYAATLQLMANHRRMVNYLDGFAWFDPEPAQLEVYLERWPDWMPEAPFWHSLARPSHVLLFDTQGRPRELFLFAGEPLPRDLMQLADLYLNESQIQVYLTALNGAPYLIAAEQVRDNAGLDVGSLMLVVPIDDAFLHASQQGVVEEQGVVAVLDGEEQRVLASSDPRALPAGSRVDSWEDKYLVTSQSFFDYQGSDLNLEFATFVPWGGAASTNSQILALERRQRVIAAAVFIAAFTLVMFLISARLNFVLRRLSRFSRRALGFERPPLRGGNQLLQLESWVNQFIRLVLAARDEMRSRHESEMRESEILKSVIMDTARDGIVTIEESGEIIESNATAEKLFRYRRSDLIGCDLPSLLLAKRSRDAFRQLLAACRRYPGSGAAEAPSQMVGVRSDGSEFPLEVEIVVIQLESRQTCTVYLHDITKRQRVEREMSNLARFASESPSPILRVNRRGVILFANAASEPLLKYWGVGRGQTLPLFWSNKVAESLESDRPREHEIHQGERIYSLLLAPVPGLDYVNVYGRDITEERLAEQQSRQHHAELVHVCRLSSMGEMSTGMAHELNQPLSAIVNFARGAMRRVRSDNFDNQTMLEVLEQISLQAERAGEIIRRLRNLVARQPPVRSSVEINDMVREVCSFVEYDMRKLGIEIHLDLSPEALPVRVDLVQIEQVLLNLVRNAMDALERVPEQRFLSIHTSAWGEDSVQVTISDTGPGIPDSDMRHLFEPFFSTKTSGMGMGLAISKTIVEDHGGHIAAESIPGGGSQFTLLLPTYMYETNSEQASGVC